MKAWRRKTAGHTADPSEVAHDLAGRVLADMDTCRRVWQEGGDPLALMEAVRLAALPEWLEDALLIALADASVERPLLPRLWKARERDARDARRAMAAGSARSFVDRLPTLTWARSYRLADARVRNVYPEEPHVSPAAVKKSYQTVARNLPDRTRYYRAKPGLSERLGAAQERLLVLMEASVAAAKSGERRRQQK